MKVFDVWLVLTIVFSIEYYRGDMTLAQVLLPTVTVVTIWVYYGIKKGIKNGFWPKERDLYLDEDERELK